MKVTQNDWGDLMNTVTKMIKNNKRTLIIVAIALIVLVLIALPLTFIYSMHNSVYDCSFTYQEIDDVLLEVARKHTYYDANNQTVEIMINQDMINSLIKDELDNLPLDLPDNISIEEVMFNTSDQRVYVNAKYSRLNVPISAKLNVSFFEEGIEVVADNLMLGEKKAPGFIRNQFSSDMLEYTLKYEELGIPQVFAVEDVVFGTGILKAKIQLEEDKIIDLALEYREDILNQLEQYKVGQSEVVVTFLDKWLDTGILSEENVGEYVQKLLSNGELVNSAIYFATADDYSGYTDTIEESQQKVMEWIEPLEDIRYYGTIDDTFNNIVYNAGIRDFLSWFLPERAVQEYVEMAEEYFGMYQEYYAIYEDARDGFETFIADIDTHAISDYSRLALEYTQKLEETRDLLLAQINLIDDIDNAVVQDAVQILEGDAGVAGEYIAMLDPEIVDLTKEYADNLDEVRADAKTELRAALDIINIDTLYQDAQRIKAWGDLTVDVVHMLQQEQYEDVAELVIDYDTANTPQKAFLKQQIAAPEWNTIDELNKIIDELEALISDVDNMVASQAF